MKELLFDPSERGPGMRVACFISGSGTNYARIAEANPGNEYIVFTNRPGCEGSRLAAEFGHPVIELSHLEYVEKARQRLGTAAPRNCPERAAFEQEAVRLVEQRAGRQPDLVCLAGYDQWVSDWMVDRFYPRILNVHPGDTTRSYDGLHWVPTAKAILAAEESIRSTLFIVDKGEDTGPVLLQSRPLDIESVGLLQSAGTVSLDEALAQVRQFAREHQVDGYRQFKDLAGPQIFEMLKLVSRALQNELKVRGDWQIYPEGVKLIGQGRVAIEGRTVYIDNEPLPAHGLRLG